MLERFLRLIILCVMLLPAAQGTTRGGEIVTIIVPFPAGGAIDAVMRMLAGPLAERLGQPIVVENIAGAGGSIGAARAAHAGTTGLTVLAGGNNDLVLQPLFNPNVRYGLQDFAPISLIFTSSLVVVARRDLPHRSIDDVVQALRTKPESLSFGTPGVGTFQHLVMEKFQRRTGTHMLHVPYKGAAPLVNDVLGGQIDIAVMAPPTALPYLRDARLKCLGVVRLERLAAYPDWPTINESHFVEGMDLTGWVGMLVPRGVSSARQEQLRAAVADVMRRAEVRQHILDMGMEPVTDFDGESFARRIADDSEAMRALASSIHR